MGSNRRPPGDIGLQHLLYFGNKGLILEHPGTLVTDIYGLDTATATWKCPMNNFNLAPVLRSPHPIWSYLHMEKREVSITPGFMVIVADYAGISGPKDPIFEMSVGAAQEPIQTHPNFVSAIAGTPSAPINGAVFLNDNGEISKDDNTGFFDRFSGPSARAVDLVGVTSFLLAEATFRRVQMSTGYPPLSQLGRINSPGSAPGLPGSLNWLYVGATFQQRGIVYQTTMEWRSSGRKGWNPLLYG